MIREEIRIKTVDLNASKVLTKYSSRSISHNFTL